MSKTFNANQLRDYRTISQNIAIINNIVQQIENVADEIVCAFDDNETMYENMFKVAIPALETVNTLLSSYRKHIYDNSCDDVKCYNGDSDE